MLGLQLEVEAWEWQRTKEKAAGIMVMYSTRFSVRKEHQGRREEVLSGTQNFEKETWRELASKKDFGSAGWEGVAAFT